MNFLYTVLDFIPPAHSNDRRPRVVGAAHNKYAAEKMAYINGGYRVVDTDDYVYELVSEWDYDYYVAIPVPTDKPKQVREADDGTSYTTVKVYPKGVSDERIKQDFPGWEGYSPCSPFDCTAEWCSSRLSITRKGSRVVASQSHYMDI